MSSKQPAREIVQNAIDAEMRAAGFRLVSIGSPPVADGRTVNISRWERDGEVTTVSIEEPAR